MDIAPHPAMGPKPEPSPPITRSFLLPSFAACASLAFFVLHCAWVIGGPERRIMDWLYDDCFYYLVLAAHFSRTHLSTFDGVTRTSGYHPLWMWLCAAIFGLRGQLDLTYVRLCMGLSTLITAGLFASAVVGAVRARRANVLWALALAGTSYSALNNGCAVMEWPLALACWAALHFVLVRWSLAADARRKFVRVAVAAFLVGVAGSLSRTDFGLVPLAYLAAALVARRVLRARFTLRPAICAATATVGSLFGVLLALIYNHAMTGEWVQRSAEVKRLLASVSSPFNPAPALWQFARVLLYLPPLTAIFAAKMRLAVFGVPLVLAAVAGAALLVRSRLKPLWQNAVACPQRMFALLAAVFGIAGYALFYAFNSQATYGWYTATITGFVLVLAAQVLETVPPRVAAAVVLPLLCLNLVAMAVGGPNARQQYAEVVIGKQMHADHAGAVMGGGDVGKPSFLNGGTLINTDGLMNNEVYPYLKSGTFPCYALLRRIEYMSDDGSITVLLTDGVRARDHLPPVPWAQYFEPVPVTMPDGTVVAYVHTNFRAIENSGECPAAQHIPVP